MIQQAIRQIKQHDPDFYVVTDVCLCEYTDHGHCGALRGREVDNDPTLELLAKTKPPCPTPRQAPTWWPPRT